MTLAPWRQETGLQPRLTDTELGMLMVMQALLATPPSPAESGTPARTRGT